MKHNACIIFFAFVAGCLLCAATGCRGSHSAASHSVSSGVSESRSGAYADSSEMRDSTAAAVRSVEEERRTESGSLRIERDSAGRPVLLLWSGSGFMQRTLAMETDATARRSGSAAGGYVAASASEITSSTTEKKQSKTYGGPLAATLALLVLGLALTARLLTPRK